MAQKLNSEFNYRTQVIGETPWAKLQTLQGFLVGRKRAAVLERVSEIKMRAKRAELEHLKETGGLQHLILNLEAEIMEVESFTEDTYKAYRLNEQEIITLENLISQLYVECEKTRVPGATDEEMFELNASNEFTVMIGKEIQAEILANGRPSAAKLRNAMSNPITWGVLKAVGLIPESASVLQYLSGFNETLQLTSGDPVETLSIEKEKGVLNG